MDTEQTMKFFLNLDRPAIEAKLREARALAASKNFGDVAAVLADVDGKAAAELDQKIKQCLKALSGASDAKALTAQLEMIQLNLPNLK